MGMAGGLLVPARLKRDLIREEGRRRGFSADGLFDFVEIVKAFDAIRVVEVRRKLYADFAAAVGKPPRQQRK